jgi:ketosteroid isomerase-like protein
MIRKLLFGFALLLLLPLLSFGQQSDEQAITKMLTAQVTEWNKGNVAGYMHGYWESDSLLFIGSKGPRYGYEATLQRYKEAYPDAAHMGVLTSVVKSMQRLSPDYYFVVGTWALKRSAGDVGGSYTLLIKKIAGKWVIVCDHSS